MNNRDSAIRASLERFFRIVNKINNRDRLPADFGTGELLYMGEIHMIEAVGKNPGTSVTELAKALGITKGAVSQMISRLESRGYVNRVSRDGSGNEISLELTAKGKKAHSGHAKYHARMYAEVFRNIEDNELDLMEKILTATENQLDASMEELLKNRTRQNR